MQDKILSTHITDTKKDIDLKVFEEDITDIRTKEKSTLFTCEVKYNKTGEKQIISFDEDVAGLMLMGLNEIFTIYEDISDKKTKPEDILTTFFEHLSHCDKNFFGEED